jgi:hypothetical protein
VPADRAFSCAFLIALVSSSVVGCVDRLPDQDRRILSAAPDAKMSADILWQEYQQDRDKANRSYWSKVIEITGTVTRVGDDVPTDRYVLFGQAGEFGVRANLLDDRAVPILARARENPRITLRCYCDGLSGNVILKSCVMP